MDGVTSAIQTQIDAKGVGSVTSVAVSGSDGIQVDSGSPLTSSGTIALGLTAVDATKIADGSVTDAEFQYINTLASNAQTQISNTVTVANAALPKAGGTMSGETIFADELATRPEIKDYAETVNVIGGTGGGTQSIDISLGNVVTATQDTGATTYTFDNPSATGKACSFTLILTNGASNSGTVWPGSVDWASSTAPTLTTSGVDVLGFLTVDGGTIWYGFAGGLDMG